MMRVLALDVGDKRIGIAVSDPLGITAQGLETYNRTGDIEKDAEYIANFAKKYAPVRLLFGMPRNMDGSYGFQSEKVKEFADAVLKLWDGEHAFFDERLTTVSAERVLMEAELDWRKRRKVVDKLAATIILQGYLDSNPHEYIYFKEIRHKMENTGKNDGYDEIVLLDENGEEASFVHVLTFVYEGQKYVALEPAEQQDDEEAEVVLLKVDTKDGQDYYNTIDNEILLNEVFDEFLDIVEEMEGEDEEE